MTKNNAPETHPERLLLHAIDFADLLNALKPFGASLGVTTTHQGFSSHSPKGERKPAGFPASLMATPTDPHEQP